MPNEAQRGPILRAPTTKERVGDFLRKIYGSVAEQPLGQISDALGITDFTGMSEPQDPDAMTLGIMPGPPGFTGPKPKAISFRNEGMLRRGNRFEPGKADIAREYESITNPEAARVAQKHGVNVAPDGNIDWLGEIDIRPAEKELNEIALRRAAAMGTEPVRLGRPNQISTTEIDHFAPTLRSAPKKRRLR